MTCILPACWRYGRHLFLHVPHRGSQQGLWERKENTLSLGLLPLHGLTGHLPALPPAQGSPSLPSPPSLCPAAGAAAGSGAWATATASTRECRTNLFQMGQGPRSAPRGAAASPPPPPPPPHPCSKHLCALGQDGLRFQESRWKSSLFSIPPQTLWSCGYASWAVTFVFLGLALKCFGDLQGMCQLQDSVPILASGCLGMSRGGAAPPIVLAPF